MSTALSTTRTAGASIRPTWRKSFLGAVWGIVAGGLASAAVIGAAVAACQLAGAGPAGDGVLDALSPLGWFTLVPVAAAVTIDAFCRRATYRLATGWQPTWGTAIAASLIAPAAFVGIGWRGGAIAWVLAVSTVLLRCCAEPVPGPPRWFAGFRSPAARTAAAAAVVVVVVGGLLALQVGTPGLRFSAPAGASPGGVAPQTLVLSNRILVDVTVLGVDGPAGDTVSIGAPLVLARGESRSVSLAPLPGCRGGATASSVMLRYRVLGIERISPVALPGELRIRC